MVARKTRSGWPDWIDGAIIGVVYTSAGTGAHAHPTTTLFRHFSPLPCCCALCGASGAEVVCPDCQLDYFSARPPRCPCCAITLPGPAPSVDRGLLSGSRSGTLIFPSPCGACQRDRPAYDASIVVTDYAAPADQLVLSLKFGGQLALAPWFAGMLHQALQRQPQDPRPDFLAAVPLGSGRLAERGYNQALEIARPLARLLGIGLNPRLAARTRETTAQTLLPPDQRGANLRGAFMVREENLHAVRGRHVGMVDDVMTTGATLAEMARLLKRHGAARVTNFVFARTTLAPGGAGAD